MHFKATEPARQPTFATEKNDRKREGWNSREKQAAQSRYKGRGR